MLRNDEVFNSVMESNRRFNHMHIRGPLSDIHLKRVEDFVQRYGHDIKSLLLHELKVPESFLVLLKLMPMLKEICMNKIKTYKVSHTETLKLDFPKLRHLSCLCCSTAVMEVFNSMKLSSLIWHTKDANLENILRGQDDLTKLDVWTADQNDLTLISGELKSLEELKLVNQTDAPIGDLALLSQLQKLKKLDLDLCDELDLSNQLGMIKIFNLRELIWNTTFNTVLNRSTICLLGRNMPQLTR